MINGETVFLKFFNTETRKKEVFKPLVPGQVKMYTCGPTVYNFAHIGNFRTYVFEDLLRRTLKFFGYQVTQVMNLTDVDDKTIKGAIANKQDLLEYTDPFKKAFFNDIKTLNIEPVEYYPAATDYIDAMIEVIEKLIEQKSAYKGNDGSVYYSIQSFPRYGCLSHLHLGELKAGASDRVASDEYDKDNISDFVLWKGYDKERDGHIFWESPFGRGRPGWHLECSVMAMKILGETMDIHVGGVDNIFPHHENEIAQSEAYTNKRFVNFWLHAEHLIVNNKKMSKSLGNFYTLRDLLDKGWTGPEVRMMLLQTHYKTQLNFTFEGLEAARISLHRLGDFIQRLLEISSPTTNEELEPLFEKSTLAFTDALADDLNISVAMSHLFDFVREVNSLIDSGKVGKGESENILEMMKRFDSVLGLLNFEKVEQEIPNDLQEALEKRIQARKEKNFALADELRELITKRGYIIEDTKEGARLKPADVK